MKNGIFVLWMFLMSGQAFGFQMTISNPQYYGAGVAFQSQLNAAATNLQNQFNQSIASTPNQEEFLQSFSNANADSHLVYSAPGVIPSNSRWFVNAGASLSLGLGPSASLGQGISFPKNQLPPIGAAAQGGITLGVSGTLLRIPSGLDPKRTMYTVSFSKVDLSSLIGKGATMNATQMSVGLSYQYYEPRLWTPLLRFNGIQLSTGLSYSSFNAGYSVPFSLSQTDASTGAQLAWNANVNVGIKSSIWSLSTQAITGIRALWCVNLYTGLGVDLSFGSSTLDGGATGPITGTQGGSTVYSATAAVAGEGESAGPSPIKLRYLLGTQFDIGIIGLYIQGQVSTSSVYGLNFGANVKF